MTLIPNRSNSCCPVTLHLLCVAHRIRIQYSIGDLICGSHRFESGEVSPTDPFPALRPKLSRPLSFCSPPIPVSVPTSKFSRDSLILAGTEGATVGALPRMTVLLNTISPKNKGRSLIVDARALRTASCEICFETGSAGGKPRLLRILNSEFHMKKAGDIHILIE